LVHEQDALAAGSRRPRGPDPRASAADDEHVDAAVLDVVAPGASAVPVDAPEPREVAQHPLVDGPQPPRSNQRPIVEPDRRERPPDLVPDRDEIAVERADHVLWHDNRAGARRRGADTDVRGAVDLHHAIRTAPGRAEKAAWPVVLEAPREDAP